MKVIHGVGVALLAAILLAGWGKALAEEKQDEEKAKANLAKLSPEDRKLAEEQKWCAVEEEHLLGSMGKPYKITIKSEPVFLCCKGCAKTAQKDPDKTLEKVKELKAKAGAQKK